MTVTFDRRHIMQSAWAAYRQSQPRMVWAGSDKLSFGQKIKAPFSAYLKAAWHKAREAAAKALRDAQIAIETARYERGLIEYALQFSEEGIRQLIADETYRSNYPVCNRDFSSWSAECMHRARIYRIALERVAGRAAA